MKKYVCIHGHFYQPPRENPWLEAVELQDSAAPYHDWNERVTAECYAPNATARILDGQGHIDRIISNYSQISFNFGPTLLSWMKDKMPEIHQAVVMADQQSRQNYSGHGSALAQVYNHLIMPLANARDKHTQVIWGIRDFERRFGRRPEGIWLSETAADTETLDVLAQHGVKFTILAPSQASRIREIGKRNWRDVSGGRVDPTRAYTVRLLAGRSLAVFFYDGPISQGIAFERLLENGEAYANRLLGAFNDQRQHDQLVHIATDGESYGHHHKHGEMALAYALGWLADKHAAQLTNYGEFLEQHPPTYEAQIHEKTAWSCIHGVGRWMSNCGCNSGGHPGWNQSWRAPLREALDWLRDELSGPFEQKAREYLKDPWEARNSYISVIMDRSAQNRNRFLTEHASRELNEPEKISVFKLLELQRHALLMYTSCGWFFDELSGIETVQVMQYAARVIQLAQEALGRDCEAGFLDRLQRAKSNLPEHGDGRRIYEKLVKPSMVDLPKTAAHCAISSLFEPYPKKARLPAYTFEDQERQLFTSGKSRLLVGRAKLVSEITQESDVLSYAILHLGEHNLNGGVCSLKSPEEFEALSKDLTAAYEAADFPETIRRMDRHFGKARYSLGSLFKDEQRRILDEILTTTREDLQSRFRLIAEQYSPLMAFLHGTGVPLPPGLSVAAELVLRAEIRRQLGAEHLSLERLQALIHEAQSYGIRVLDSEAGYEVVNRMEQLMAKLAANPDEADSMGELEKLAGFFLPLPIGLNLWRVQNMYWEMLQSVALRYRERAANGDGPARGWLDQFLSLGHRLGFGLKEVEAAPVPLKAAA